MNNNSSNSKLAVVFPGQSSEHIGMLSNLAIHYKLVKEIFAEVSDILNYDIWKLIQYGSSNTLHQTCYAQPSVLTASVAIWKIWVAQGGQIPSIMSGHSLGEYSALVCAGSINLLSAVKLVMIRSMLMQEVSPQGYGAMSVIIGLDDHIISELCKTVSSIYNQTVAISGFNALKNIVISGHREAVYKVNALCQSAGAKYIAVLPISVASHCNLMKPMTDRFQKELEKFTVSVPNIPIINNTDVYIETNPKFIKNALVRQLYTPVRWIEIMQKIKSKNINKFLEMGPSKVLTRLIKNSIANVFSISINDCNSLSEAMKNLNN